MNAMSDSGAGRRSLQPNRFVVDGDNDDDDDDDDNEVIVYINKRKERSRVVVCALRIVCKHFFEPSEIERQKEFSRRILVDWETSYDALLELSDIEAAKFTGVSYIPSGPDEGAMAEHRFGWYKGVEEAMMSFLRSLTLLELFRPNLHQIKATLAEITLVQRIVRIGVRMRYALLLGKRLQSP